ncbi:MAG: type Z 30S ribosomal protein S14 [Armatimonadetes bacterium]|nr:type Z 30S ribosomal protein S14 [Armatimonadota bacterium]NIM24266.1 type Z 30S ribosomal protein S14 [Armatimonadota bacterium]NIM68135.1 type Z 30S ribosomal protein S14 [Armatimonadota bacterium]NIM76597.1 type Z 30S ribosomal protein S14 [Armatimonadota bacterium]NIN06340.1 type Z 30S ribosomal protein S14 [Armatimonadota bacterium]
MAKKSWLAKTKRPAKFKVRNYSRCKICGRARGYFRRFGMCRVCIREMARKGLLPGVTKSSW